LPAQEGAPAARELAREIAPYLDEQLLAVLHVDLSKLDPEAVGKALRKAGVAEADAEQAATGLKMILAGLRGAGLKRGFAVFSLAEVPEQPPLIVLPIEQGRDADALGKLLGQFLGGQMRFEKRGVLLVGGTARALKRVRDL